MAKTRIPRTAMPLRPPQARIRDFLEVATGFTPEMAIQEAQRCLACKNPTCEAGCPVRVPIREFITLVAKADFTGAARKIKEQNALPAICGRVCPQETQCEQTCILTKRFESVAVGRLERFVADYEREQGEVAVPELAPSTGQKVAIVGSGPAGLTAAGDLARLGYQCTIFEALHAAGGVLMYGIPQFRLPKETVQAEVNYLRQMGVEVVTNVVVGQTITVDDLFDEGYDAVFLGTGAGLPKFMRIPGENLNGVYSANEFLTRINLMKAYLFPEYDTPVRPGKRVVTVGGGNTAMDGARSARRFPGVEESYLVYRRSRHEMPAREEEIEHAEEEGINFKLLTNPVRILGNEEGRVTGIECVRMELGEPDPSGRRRPVEVKDSNFVIPCDSVVMAIGQEPNPLIMRTTEGLETNKWNCVVVDADTGAASREGVFAAGDVITGGATVILAMGQARVAAAGIDAYLRRKRGAEVCEPLSSTARS